MSNLAKALIGIGCAFLVICISAFFFFRHLITKSFPTTSGTLEVNGIHTFVDIFRDEYGVPHISAQDEHDLMFTVGYVHAQDRLWQMDLMRRAGDGRLSEVLGKATLDFDMLFRTIGLNRIADSITEHLHPESKQALQDYADGVNAFITTHKGALPAEFDMLNYEPEPWKIRHSILIARLIAWELNLAWWTDLTYGEIATRVSTEKFKEILPLFPDSIPTTLPSSVRKKNFSSIRPFKQVNTLYRDFFGLGSLEAGSNAWAVDSSKSLSGKPILANDPHLAMPCPSRWYEVHMTAPGWNTAGVSLPGTPVIIIGHNEHLAWGLTNAMIDDADFFVEDADTTHPNHYIFRRSSLPMEMHEEKIYIGTSDSLALTVRSTLHGPIINDVHPSHLHRDSLQHIPPIAMRWTGLDISDEVYALYLMNKATSAVEFERGIKEFAVPAQAVVYADVKGNIGYWTAGHVPIRGKQNALLPLQGSTGEADWKGFVPFEHLPKVWNPPGGFIACANQKIADDSYPYYLSTLWEPPSRIQRIRQLLQSAEKFSSEDFEQFQQDVFSNEARETSKYLLRSLDSVSVHDAEMDAARNYLKNWDFRFTKGDIATTIYNAFFVKLIHNIYEDELGPELFRDFVYFGAIPYRVTSQLLASDHSSWFDDVATDHVETKNEILRKSLKDALDELHGQFGPEMKTWRWGDVHSVTFNHPFGKRKPLDKVFNLGPFSVAGGGTTVNKSEYKFTSPYTTSVGASMRFVIDLKNPLVSYSVITSGESGQPLHKHYDDQTPLWLNGAYHSVTMDWDEIRSQKQDHLRLQPAPRQ